MGQFSFQLPDAKESAIIDAWCIQEGYQELIDNGRGEMVVNPQTKLQFARQTLKRHFIRAYVRQQAESARLAAIELAEGEV